MSVLIKDMEKSKSGYAVIDGESEYCPFVNTDNDCVLLLKKGICEETWEMQYSKCPLVETPEPCEDAINRQKLLNDLKELKIAWKKYPVMAKQIEGVEAAIKYVETIPSVTPKRKTGTWTLLEECANAGYYCSECRKKVVKEGWSSTVKKIKFCPNCGADMRQREENK